MNTDTRRASRGKALPPCGVRGGQQGSRGSRGRGHPPGPPVALLRVGRPWLNSYRGGFLYKSQDHWSCPLDAPWWPQKAGVGSGLQEEAVVSCPVPQQPWKLSTVHTGPPRPLPWTGTTAGRAAARFGKERGPLQGPGQLTFGDQMGVFGVPLLVLFWPISNFFILKESGENPSSGSLSRPCVGSLFLGGEPGQGHGEASGESLVRKSCRTHTHVCTHTRSHVLSRTCAYVKSLPTQVRTCWHACAWTGTHVCTQHVTCWQALGCAHAWGNVTLAWVCTRADTHG